MYVPKHVYVSVRYTHTGTSKPTVLVSSLRTELNEKLLNRPHWLAFFFFLFVRLSMVCCGKKKTKARQLKWQNSLQLNQSIDLVSMTKRIF